MGSSPTRATRENAAFFGLKRFIFNYFQVYCFLSNKCFCAQGGREGKARGLLVKLSKIFG